tara:strand:- start:141 stop:500 length:360 start_codon:yes stop_codon:yes gene_type:complete
MSKVTAMDNTMEVESPKRTLSSRQKVMAGFALMVLTQGVFAAAPTSGEFLFGVYDEIMGWLTGAPGIIISILTFGFAGFQGIVKQNYAACVGAFLIALLFANAQDAIEYFLTASVGVPL